MLQFLDILTTRVAAYWYIFLQSSVCMYVCSLPTYATRYLSKPVTKFIFGEQVPLLEVQVELVYYRVKVKATAVKTSNDAGGLPLINRQSC